jgi:hypothetical protein
MVAGKIKSTKYEQGWGPGSYNVTIEVIKSNGVKFYRDQVTFEIGEYEGVKKIEDLPIRPITDASRSTLVARGKKFRVFGEGVHHLEYDGNMIIKNYRGEEQVKARGRIMADGIQFQKNNPNYWGGYESNPDSEYVLDHLEDEQLAWTWPRLLGFSLRCKKWGEFWLDQLEVPNYDKASYERLVMDDKKKRLVKAKVKNNEADDCTDIISGKGGGCIFLLHGPPGTGKTLTAEAVAEVLHRPLYSVSVGELGVNPSQLETKIKEILEVASTWNAVCLIDEADIFMERRVDNDILRNAMVGVFLRELEYHQGVLFLTTNRVKSFDKAFMSRINIKISYPDLSEDARAKVWRNHLDFHGLRDKLDQKVLAKHDINGRQIRNIVQLAVSLAKLEGDIEITEKMIEETIATAEPPMDNMQNHV